MKAFIAILSLVLLACTEDRCIEWQERALKRSGHVLNLGPRTETELYFVCVRRAK